MTQLPEWAVKNIDVTVARVVAGAVGDALRQVARELDSQAVDPEIVDRVYRQAAAADGVRVVRMTPGQQP